MVLSDKGIQKSYIFTRYFEHVMNGSEVFGKKCDSKTIYRFSYFEILVTISLLVKKPVALECYQNFTCFIPVS
jgi:hypothetical protein